MKDDKHPGIKQPLYTSSADKLFQENIKGKDRKLMARLRGYLLAGILVTAPITITVYLTYLFLTFVDGKVALVLPTDWYQALYGKATIPGIGLVVAVTFFVCVGWFATNFLGRILILISEKILARMPIIRTIYGATKQVLETVMTSQSNAFREVVMFEYPRKGSWSMGFVTGSAIPQVGQTIGEETVNVFIPTAPLPTQGFLLFIPRKDLISLDITVEEGIKLVVSGGMLKPDPDSPGKAIKETGRPGKTNTLKIEGK